VSSGIRVFTSLMSMGQASSSLQDWLNGCLTECQSSGTGWERVALLSQLVWRPDPFSYWVAVFETEEVRT